MLFFWIYVKKTKIVPLRLACNTLNIIYVFYCNFNSYQTTGGLFIRSSISVSRLTDSNLFLCLIFFKFILKTLNRIKLQWDCGRGRIYLAYICCPEAELKEFKPQLQNSEQDKVTVGLWKRKDIFSIYMLSRGRI